ncbi:M14 metallopeptidase family protein [Flavihumibacter stibioxidans]|uniref:Zinc carboxypeptidase n=1 Tax=Flavihumibacter stibioxidans TaxID=1834163 RepID=A0ABR7M5C7_9BACT|nr:M14 metallopeptidase family protein [Flavihumibacter stibioxidans]MBC6490215.1 zinc carboxypeptidase [Flavihumibacter stibioxidans]
MRRFFVLISSMLLGLGAGAQELSYYLPSNVTYDPAVPTPEQVIGHHVGEWHVTHDRLVSYMRAIAAAAPSRVTIQETGRTYESRPQLLLIFTSQANHSRLENIRQEHLKLSDPAYGGPVDTDKMPTVLWQGFSIHGNEPSGANAALLGAYYLAAAQGPSVDSLLNEVVVLFDPSFNPDGLNRFATWANMHKSQHLVTDPASREFNEVWPGGRYNHYWFDLNRDWLPAQHLESRNRLKVYQQWRPNILTDHHEMGSDATFFFQPGEPSRVNPLTPVKNQQLTQAVADYHAAYLNKIGSLYYTKEGYDDFYYGKGSTYPDAQGCIGILFEQASSRGHAQETSNGVLSFPFTIRNQFTTVLSTLAAAKGLRKELLNYQRDFYRQMAKDAAASPVKGWVFGDPDDESRNHIFVEMLQRHEIKVKRLTAPLAVGGQNFEAGKAFVVPVNQPQYKLIQTFFEKTLEYRDSIFYDITAWTMPLAMGLPYSSLNAAQLGAARTEVINTVANSGGKMIGGSSSYAYAFEWAPLYAPRMLNKLLQEGIAAKVVSNPFVTNVNGQPKKFGYGTILIPLQLQKEDAGAMYEKLKALAASNNVDVYAISTGMSVEGSDIGSRYMLPLTKPSVAMLVGAGVSALDAGEVWHLLDQRFEMPPSMLEAAVFNRVSLNRYSTIVMVSGNYDAFNKEKLRAWVQAGGNLVLMEDAISWAQQNGLVKLAMKKLKPAVDSGKALPYVSLPYIERAQQLSGAIVGARMDLTHPLCYGYSQPTISLFKQNRVFMEKPANPFAAPVGYGIQPLQSGYVTSQNLDGLKESAAVVVQAVGAGRVISIAENPNFRAYWLGGAKLFLNSIFFGRLIDAGSARAEE